MTTPPLSTWKLSGPDADADAFGVDRSVVTKHITNIFSDGELDRLATCAKFALLRLEGGRQVSRDVDHYNLDVILSVGYRVSSPWSLFPGEAVVDDLVLGHAHRVEDMLMLVETTGGSLAQQRGQLMGELGIQFAQFHG